MKHLFQLVIICLFPLLGISQTNAENNFDIKVGKPYRMVDSQYNNYLVYEDVLLNFKWVKDEVIVEKFNTNTLAIESTKTYSDFPDRFVIENIEILKDKCYLYYSLWDKKDETEQLFCRELDINKGTFHDISKLLFKVKGKVTGTMAGNGRMYGIQIVDKFKFQKSYDDSHLSVNYRKKPRTKNDDKNFDEIGFYVYDADMNELWGKEVRMPYHESQMDNLDYYVSEQGDFYMLTTVFKDHSGRMKLTNGKANYHIELLKITGGTDEITKTPIMLKSNLINSIALYQALDNELVMGGYYSGKDINQVEGVFSFRVDAGGVLKDEFKYEFPVDFLNENASNKQIRKNERKDKNDKAEMSDLKMREVFAGEDGAITIIGEKVFFKTSTSTNGKVTTFTFFYQDIIASKIDSAGHLVWNKKLPKRQVGTQGTMDMSFEHMTLKGNHYFLFLDNINNKNLNTSDVPKAHRSGAGGWLTAYIIDSQTGVVSKSYYLDTRKVKGVPIYKFSTDRIVKTSENSFVFEVYRKNKQDVLIEVRMD